MPDVLHLLWYSSQLLKTVNKSLIINYVISTTKLRHKSQFSNVLVQSAFVFSIRGNL